MASGWLRLETFVKWIRDDSVVANVFGDRIHPQAIKRFHPVLRLLGQQRVLKFQDVSAVRVHVSAIVLASSNCRPDPFHIC